MLPRVILYNSVTVDGRMDWFAGEGDMGLYYELAARWNADAMLSGSNTMLTAYAQQQDAPEKEEGNLEAKELHPLHVPLLVIVDSRGQVRNWRQIQREPFWRKAISLCSHSTPPSHLAFLEKRQVEYIVAGDDRVDLRAALEQLNLRYGVKVVRVDSGGALNGAGLVDEVSILMASCLTGGASPRSIFVAPDLTSSEGVIPLRLIHMERLRGDLVWLRYDVIK
jgi:2,5-diamino-6-(ribosylamino)-4(3H)-pyrimidinone 5'-phosphate reductase